MRKLSVSILTAILIVTFTGCSAKNNTPSSTSKNISLKNAVNSGSFKDGIYDVKHSSTKGGFEEAVVTIENGKIKAVDLKRLDKKQKEVNYNEWDGTKWEHPNLKKYRIDLGKAIVDKQSPDVDSITGATESSNGWKLAVDEALTKAK